MSGLKRVVTRLKSMAEKHILDLRSNPWAHPHEDCYADLEDGLRVCFTHTIDMEGEFYHLSISRPDGSPAEDECAKVCRAFFRRTDDLIELAGARIPVPRTKRVVRHFAKRISRSRPTALEAATAVKNLAQVAMAPGVAGPPAGFLMAGLTKDGKPIVLRSDSPDISFDEAVDSLVDRGDMEPGAAETLKRVMQDLIKEYGRKEGEAE